MRRFGQYAVVGLGAVVLIANTAAAGDRVITAALTDKQGSALKSVAATDVAVMENGVAKEVVEVTPDNRPLALVLLLDTSAALESSYRLSVVPAIAPFLKQLPEGSRYTLWTTGDRPTRLVDWSDDPSQADRALKRVIVQGGNTALDALLEATEDLGAREEARSVVVVIAADGPDFSNISRERAVDDAIGRADVFYAIEILENGSLPYSVEYALSNLTQKSGGLLDRPLSAMALEKSLNKVAADLSAQYRVSYREASDDKKAKITVNVAHPGAKARVISSRP